MNEDQALFQFTNDAVNLLLHLASPSNEGTVLVLGSVEGFPEVADNFKIRRVTDPNELTKLRTASFDGAIVIPQFDAEVDNPAPPSEGDWALPNPCNMQAYLIAHAWSQVRQGGRIVALVGRDLLAVDRGNRAELRKALREHGLSVIAEVPNKAFRNSGVNTPTYIAIFIRKAEASQSIALVNLAEGEEELPTVSAFNAWCMGQTYPDISAEQVFVTPTEIESDGNRIDPDFHGGGPIHDTSPKTEFDEFLLNEKADVITGFQLVASKRLITRPEESAYRYLLVGNINQDGTIRDNACWVREADVQQHLEKLTKAGDILISATGTIGKIALIPESSDRLLYNASLRRIRVKSGSNIGSQDIAAFLRSPEGQYELSRHDNGAVIPNLSNKNLAKVRIRVPKDSNIAETTSSSRPRWFVGATWGAGNDHTSRFVDEGIWENGYEDRYLDEVKSIQVGDRIAIKSTYTRKHNLPFDNRGQSVSVMAIKAIGIVKENPGDGRSLKVEWASLNNRREWYFYTYRATAWRVSPGEWMSDALIAFTFDQKDQDITRFRNTPYWKLRFGDDPSADLRFQWTKFYQAIADKLLDFKDDRSKLVAGIHPIVSRVDGTSYLQDQFKDGTSVPLEDICPFTAMGIFNRGLTETNRKNIASKLAKFLGVTETVPTSFDGVPVLDNRKSWFFRYHEDRQNNDIDVLWNLFAAAIRFADSDDVDTRSAFVGAYDNAIQRSGVGWNLTIGLYWVRPWEFPTLDSKSRPYIAEKLGVEIGMNSFKGTCTGDQYVSVLEKLEARFRDDTCPVHSFPELSLAALQLDAGQADSVNEVIVDADGDNNVGTAPQPTITVVPPHSVQHPGAKGAAISPQDEKRQTPAPSKRTGVELTLSIHNGQTKLLQNGTEVWSREGLLPESSNLKFEYNGATITLQSVLNELHDWDKEKTTALGDFLGDTLFRGTLPQPFRDALSSVGAGDQLRLVLDLAPGAAWVPWEYIRCNHFFLIEQRVSIVRHINAEVPVHPFALNTSTCKLLFAWANPETTEQFIHEGHIERVKTRLDSMFANVRSLERCSPRALQHALHHREAFHAFHYLGHGMMQSDAEPVLELHAEPGKASSDGHVNARDLATWLGNSRRSLVFLAACHGGAAPTMRPFSGLAHEIVRLTGTPVVAMQVAVPRDFATEFSCQFYHHLEKTRSIEKAVYLARQVLHDGRHAFGIPVLYADINKTPIPLDLPEPPTIAWSFTALAPAHDATRPALPSKVSTYTSPNTGSEFAMGGSINKRTQVSITNAILPLPVISAGEIDLLDNQELKIDWEIVKAQVAGLTARYAFPESLVYRVIGELAAGRHVLLIGPVGTGKTSLAREICEMLGQTPMVATAAADWTTFDIVGGYFPHGTSAGNDTKSQQVELAFRNGVFTEAVLKNWTDDASTVDGRRAWRRTLDRHWLVLDEMNRADMDRAMGAVFTALESRKLPIPCAKFDPCSPSTTELPIPKDFRVIATMNAIDRHYLFRLSDALKRRFAFIEVPVTSAFNHEWQTIVERCKEQPPPADLATQFRRFAYLVRRFHPLGTAQVLAGARFLAATQKSPLWVEERLTQAIAGSILPGLEESPTELLGLLETWTTGDFNAFFAELCTVLKSMERKNTPIGGVRLTDEEFANAISELPEVTTEGNNETAITKLAQRLARGKETGPLATLGHLLGEMKRMNESYRV